MSEIILGENPTLLEELFIASNGWVLKLGYKEINKIHYRETNYNFLQKQINEFKLKPLDLKIIVDENKYNEIFSFYALDVYLSLFQFLTNLSGYYNNNTIFTNLNLVRKYEEEKKKTNLVKLKKDKYLNQVLYYNNKNKVFTRKTFSDLLKNSLQYKNRDNKYYHVQTFKTLDELANYNLKTKVFKWYEDVYRMFKKTFYILKNNKTEMKKYIKLNDFSNIKTSLEKNNNLIVNPNLFDCIGIKGNQLICFKSKTIDMVLNNKNITYNLSSKTLMFKLLIILIHYQILVNFSNGELDVFNKIDSIKIINFYNMKEKVFYLEDVNSKVVKFLLNGFMSITKELYHTTEKINWSELLTNLPFFRKFYKKKKQ